MGDDSLDIKELDVVRLKNGQEATILEVFQSALRENFSLTEEVDAHQKMNLIQ